MALPRHTFWHPSCCFYWYMIFKIVILVSCFLKVGQVVSNWKMIHRQTESMLMSYTFFFSEEKKVAECFTTSFPYRFLTYLYHEDRFPLVYVSYRMAEIDGPFFTLRNEIVRCSEGWFISTRLHDVVLWKMLTFMARVTKYSNLTKRKTRWKKYPVWL